MTAFVYRDSFAAMPPKQEWRVSVGADAVSAVYEEGSAPVDGAVFVCAHGAGGNMADRGVQTTANALRARGLAVVRFNFPYTERKSGRPDPMPTLQQCVAAVVARTREALAPKRLLIGGRSMGGRAASMLAADGFECDGLLLLAYPLHPAGKPEQLRDAHLPRITVPTICFNGTRDPLCRRDLMEAVLPRLAPGFTMHWIEGADHSFHVLKSSGRTDADAMNEIAEAAGAWIEGVPASR
jgi:predicted alpha/beta-hydrolase family hydrolase